MANQALAGGVPVDAPVPAAAAAAPQAQAPGSSNRWDFLIVATVVLALFVLTIFLSIYFKRNPSSITTILGIVVPAFAAVFGATLGHTAGKAAGRELGKQQVKDKVLPKLMSIQGRTDSLVNTMRTHTENPVGTRDWRLMANYAAAPVTLTSNDEMDSLTGDIEIVRGYLENL